MEDIVALKVVLEKGPNHYFLTWGRLLDLVETKGLEELVGSHLSKFALNGAVVSISVCDSIREAAGARYFYECFFQMCQKTIPFGDAYRPWAAQMLEQLEQGREIYYLGPEIETGFSRPRT
ncbi:MAG: hypothetical protein M3Z28_13160 [Candidatus Dormibacteraeota bacterium]|nr:hypothetical protein [Candidatus Dormibacteraeota bacterium]